MKSFKRNSSYNLIIWIMAAEIILGLSILGGGIYVLLHFVSKYW